MRENFNNLLKGETYTFLTKLEEEISSKLLKKNIIYGTISKTTYKELKSEEEILDESSYFEINNKKYLRKNKIKPKEYTLLTFSEFPINFSADENLFYKKDLHLSSEFLPNLFDFYNIYFLKKSEFHDSNIKKLICPSIIKKIGFVNYKQDLLKGYNFYIQTEDKLYILSTILSSKTVQFVQALRKNVQYAKQLGNIGLRLGLGHSGALIRHSVDFDQVKFFEVNREFLRIYKYKLNECFDICLFRASFLNLKKLLRFFKFNENLACYIQSFLYYYHQKFSKSLCNTRFQFEINQMSEVYKLMLNYNYLIEKYGIFDIYLKSFLVNFNNNLFDKFIKKILTKVKVYMIRFFNEKDTESDFFKNILNFIISDNIAVDSNFKITFAIFYKIIYFVIEAIEKNIVFNADLSFSLYLKLLNSLDNFKVNFLEIINKNLNKKFEKKFLQKMSESGLYFEIKGVYRTIFNEIEKTLEKKIQVYYNRKKEKFINRKLKNLFTPEYIKSLNLIKKKLNLFFSEILFNNLLNFLIEFYFAKLFKDLVIIEERVILIKKLKNDKSFLKNIFKSLIKKENLEVLLQTFENFLILLNEQNRDLLMKALIKFDVFFNNRLTTDILVSILIKNFNVALDVEEDLIDFFNQCIYINRQKSILEEESTNGDSCKKSRILFNSTKSKKKLKNYLPHLTFNCIMRLKEMSFLKSIRSIFQKNEDSLDLSFDSDLVNFDTHEKFLKNQLKMIHFSAEEYSEELFYEYFKNQNYEKIQCIVDQNEMFFYDLNNYEIFFKAEIRYLRNLKTLNDLVFSFSYYNKTYLIILPTKIERNLWFYSIKNMKRDLNFVEIEDLKKIKTKSFEIDYSFKNKEELQLEIPIKNLKKNEFNKNDFYSYKTINNFVSKMNTHNQHQSRRKSIDITDLKEFNDPDFETKVYDKEDSIDKENLNNLSNSEENENSFTEENENTNSENSDFESETENENLKNLQNSNKNKISNNSSYFKEDENLKKSKEKLNLNNFLLKEELSDIDDINDDLKNDISESKKEYSIGIIPSYNDCEYEMESAQISEIKLKPVVDDGQDSFSISENLDVRFNKEIS